MMEIEQLWEEIDDRVACLPVRPTGLAEAMHRVVAAEVLSPCDLPAFDQSSMDGFAFASARPGACRILATVAAGRPLPLPVTSGTACRILTGAVVPEGTAAVAKQEDCAVEGELVTLIPGVSIAPGENIRRRGGIFQRDDILIASGTQITAGVIALLASAGVQRIPVHGRASVLHLVTGDEIVGPGAALLPGQTYDSNGPMIQALLGGLGINAEQCHLPDDADSLLQRVLTSGADVLLISGGSGPGERDHTLGALESAGYSIHSSRLNSRPGKPLIFATNGSRIAFGLPGNPLSHWVCFQAFVRWAIRRLHGLPPPEMRTVRMVAAIERDGDRRRTWTPGVLEHRDGREMVRPLPWKHSGDLLPIAGADALILGADKNGDAKVMIL